MHVCPRYLPLPTNKLNIACNTVSLSVWRDEAKGLINGMKPEENDNDNETIDLTSDAEPTSPQHKPDINLNLPRRNRRGRGEYGRGHG